MTYPTTPGFKERGQPGQISTSQAAAVAISCAAPKLRASILERMIAAPWLTWTADEMAEELNVSILAVRPRFTELAQMGEIVRTGMRRPSSQGNPQCVYRPAPETPHQSPFLRRSEGEGDGDSP